MSKINFSDTLAKKEEKNGRVYVEKRQVNVEWRDEQKQNWFNLKSSSCPALRTQRRLFFTHSLRQSWSSSFFIYNFYGPERWQYELKCLEKFSSWHLLNIILLGKRVVVVERTGVGRRWLRMCMFEWTRLTN